MDTTTQSVQATDTFLIEEKPRTRGKGEPRHYIVPDDDGLEIVKEYFGVEKVATLSKLLIALCGTSVKINGNVFKLTKTPTK
jgi:hypothetical protein